MGTKLKKPESLKVDREKFTEVIKKLVNTGPIKREDVKGSNPKAGKVIEKS